MLICSRVTPTSTRINSRVDGEIYRSLSRERRMGYGMARARSGSRERRDDRVQRSEERGRRADSSGPRRSLPRPSPSPTGAGTFIVSQTFYLLMLTFLIFAHLLSYRVTSSTLWPNCLYPGQTAATERGWNQKVCFHHFSIDDWSVVNFFFKIKALNWVVVCVSDRESYGGICWHHPLSPRGDGHAQERPILSRSGPTAEAGVYLWSAEAAGTPLTAR